MTPDLRQQVLDGKVRCYKHRMWFIAPPGSPPGIEKADCVVENYGANIEEAIKKAITSTKDSKIFRGLVFDRCTSQELRGKTKRWIKLLQKKATT